tara:strand:+ start:2102 stop:2494 length:393 start_codon:yes stop_codon:yes gene_type:complete
MPKKPSRKTFVKILDNIFSIYIRLRESKNEIVTCFTCNKKEHYKKFHCGHFQSRRHISTRWDEVNCQVQCAGCNSFRGGEQFIFGRNLDIKYGRGTAENLLIKSKQILKLSILDLKSLINKYNSLVDSID